MIERLVKCPLCKSGLFLNAIEVKDHAVSKENFIICNCTKCSIKFTNPRPKLEHIDRYYDFIEYYSHNDSTKNFTQLIYQTIKKRATKGKVKLINSFVSKKGTLLDYGCGTGEFILRAKENGWNVTGIEPNEKARNIASDKLGAITLASIDSLPKTQQFDVITLFHVLEHVHKLRKTVKRILSHLESNGYIIIAIPNSESYDAKKYKEYWAGWDVPRHLYHFSADSMKSFEKTFDLELVDLKKMPFDSYYVSLLSESYQHPSNSTLLNYWKALKTGLISNKKTKGKAGSYSSNIYIYRKK